MYSHHSNHLRLAKDTRACSEACVQNLSRWEEAVREIRTWPEYERQPLRTLDNSAKSIGIAKLFYKDESMRFGPHMASFKALGAPYAVYHLLADEVHLRTGLRPSSDELRSNKYRNITERVTVCVATDGNQGRGLAYGAKVFGCRCVDYVHTNVSTDRTDSMEKQGAIVIRVNGEYEESVKRAKEDAKINGWHFVSSTSWDDFSAGIPQMVMNAYMVLWEEACEIIPEVEKTSHVFMCGGVGSIAAAMIMGFFSHCQQDQTPLSRTTIGIPRFVVIEPDEADCLSQSSKSGIPTSSTGSLRTIMAGLACRDPSPAAFKLLSWLASDFVTVPDSFAVDGMRALAAGNEGDIPIVCGESSGASMGLMLKSGGDTTLRKKLGLDQHSRVVLFGCEGATDAKIYEQLVGMTPDAVFREQADYLKSHDTLP